MLRINLNDPNAKLRDVVDAALKGEDILITTENGQTVQLTPVPGKKGRRAGTAEGQIWMADDFDEPLEDFKDYME